ncbi:ABC transporter permease [Lapidilactobacillus gannanensis]|uniref:ABC transporter permease n=1 Tax=Lapidilactobacillus gannanensis TaxID=2486002 RepID=A0ABW4BJZ0_9LACO|nr:ABC transporter permease subunit [Lapidilactobacillus gannanensis]
MKKSLFKRLHDQIFYQSMIWPAVILMILFNFIPMYGLIIAFKDYTVLDTIGGAPWVGLSYFKEFFKDPLFWSVMKNTVGIAFWKLLIGFPGAIILAILINEVANAHFKKFVQTISYLPHFLSWVILGGMVITWLSDSGFINSLLMDLNLISKPIEFMADTHKYWGIAVLSDFWKEVGWGTILYLASMTAIDPSLYEAAKMDGATKFQQVIHITIPGIRQMISLNLILSIGGLLGSNLDQTLVLQNSLNYSSSEVLNSYVYKMGIKQGNFSYATAVGIFVSIISLLLVLLSRWGTRKISDKSVF